MAIRKYWKLGVVILFLPVLVLQSFQIDRTAPPINPTETLEAAVSVPADISMIIGRSCNDCHSHKTSYPWYAYVQPTGWFLKGHIDDGREELNFSVFNTYSDSKKAKKLEEVCDEVTAGSMPLPSYLWIHRSAALSDSDRKALCDWTAKGLEGVNR